MFCEDQDYLEYLKILKRVSEACHCAIHAHVLMTNHIHAGLTVGELGRIRNCTQSGTPMGSAHFKEQIAKTLSRKVSGENVAGLPRLKPCSKRRMRSTHHLMSRGE
jgi:REP element-mobilizing transposase RayT